MKKPYMHRVLLTTVLIVTFVLASRSAHDQAKPVNPAALLGAGAAPPEEHLKVENGSIWVRQPGESWVRGGDATVGNAVKALRSVYPEITFAVDPRVAAVPVTDLLIRANQPNTDLEALRTACGGRFDLSGGLIDPSGQPSSLYQLVDNNLTEQNSSKKEDRNIECFNLTGYLERRFKANDVRPAQQAGEALRMVDQLKEIINQTISDFDGDIKMPQFQFYDSAQLLIVTGSNRAIAIAAKVIRALPGEEGLFGNLYDGGNFHSLGRRLPDQPMGSQGMQPDSALDPSAINGGAGSPAAQTIPNASYSPVPATKP